MFGRKKNREKEYITKISNEKIKNFNFEGDYLYKDKPCETFVRDSYDGNFYFAKKFGNLLIYVDKKYNEENDKPGQLMYNSLDKYLSDLAYLCSQSKEKPSLLFVDTPLDVSVINNYLTDYQRDVETIDDYLDKSIYGYILPKNDDPNYIENYLKELAASRSDFNKVRKSVFVVIFNPQNLNISILSKLLILGKSRKMHFIIVAEDLEKMEQVYKDGEFGYILDNCQNKIVCSKDRFELIKIASSLREEQTIYFTEHAKMIDQVK